MSERQNIDEFLACKRIAFVGVSTNEKHFSRAVMRELVASSPIARAPESAEFGSIAASDPAPPAKSRSSQLARTT